MQTSINASEVDRDTSDAVESRESEVTAEEAEKAESTEEQFAHLDNAEDNAEEPKDE